MLKIKTGDYHASSWKRFTRQALKEKQTE
jgi:hypothetical protein